MLGAAGQLEGPPGALAAASLDPLDAQQLAHRGGGLRAARQPAASALLVENDRRGVGLRVVVTDRLDHAAVARRALIGDDDAPNRILLAAPPCEPQPNRHVFLSAGCLIAANRA